jgi:uncharacterized protein with ParB-like and HNH nuclease domain
MKANAAPLLAIFEKKMRLEVPLFQRQYVWSREQQWEPLWEDISRKFTDYLDGRKDSPVHFLGAMVLDQRQTPTTHVEKRQVIDGQQRLTTLQIFLTAFRDFARTNQCNALAEESDSFILNKGMMADPEVDRFKVWPTQSDRAQFADVVTSGSRAALEKKHPVVWQKWARKPDARPRMIEAYIFFANQLQQYFNGDASEPPIASDVTLSDRLEECFQALRNALHVVVIDLEQGDDAQVIFETLNARGEPLLPADLLRNFIFLRAGRSGESQELLYSQYWQQFDDAFWRTEVKQGRLTRPRSDLFLQHFLSSRQTVDVPVKHLFVEYKHWIEKHKPFGSVQEELDVLSRQGAHFRRIIEPKKSDPIYRLVTFLDVFDVRTVYPLLLHLLDSDLADAEWQNITTVLESYFLRRALCGLTTKNYNRVFLSLTKTMRTEGASSDSIIDHLRNLSGDSTVWPTDGAFRDAWMARHAYATLQNPKVVLLFKRLNETFISSKQETVTVEGPLTVEHLMPQDWAAHWPLPDGSAGITGADLWLTPPENPRAMASKSRNQLVQTIGNLTILTQPLNAAASNGPWEKKRLEILKQSLLPINQDLYNYDEWDEASIEHRGSKLFDRALMLWPRG